jgi:hypothetical protein
MVTDVCSRAGGERDAPDTIKNNISSGNNSVQFLFIYLET